jgi:hypothetical protein
MARHRGLKAMIEESNYDDDDYYDDDDDYDIGSKNSQYFPIKN